MKPKNNVTISTDLIASIYNGSIGLVSVCLIIITLFQVTNKSALYIFDELMSLTVAIYLTALIIAYQSMNNSESQFTAKLAHRVFVAALSSTIISIIVLVYEFQKYA